MYNNCCVVTCASRRKDVKFHRFPKTEIGLQKWLQCINCTSLKSLGYAELHKLFVCEKHFEKRFFTSSRQRSRLRVDAYPTLFTDDELSNGVPQTPTTSITDHPGHETVEHSCSKKRQHQDHTYVQNEFARKQSRIEKDASQEEDPQRKWCRGIMNYTDLDGSEQSYSEQQQKLIEVDASVPQDKELATELMAESMLSPDPLSEEPLWEVDAELPAAIGGATNNVPSYGEKIIPSLAEHWMPLLCKGIAKDKKDALLKKQTIPENCKFLRAPSLNEEVSAAISDRSRTHDKKLEYSQNQLGLGIAAVGRGLSLLLTSDDKQKKAQAIKSISDGCQVLADLHYTETQARVKLIVPGLDIEVERDETLFGSNLSEM